MQTGDILAFYGVDAASTMIRAATCWPLDPWSCWRPPSHVAMVWEHRGRPLLVESTTLCGRPCVVRGEPVSGTQAHFPYERVGDYVSAGGSVDLYQISGEINALTPGEDRRLNKWCEALIQEEASYDMRGAILSGSRLMPLLHLLPDANLQSMFCSELLAAVLMRVGLMNIGNPGWYNPGRLIRELVRTGKYERVRQVAPCRISQGSNVVTPRDLIGEFTEDPQCE